MLDTSCGLRVAGCGLRVARCGLRVARCGLRVASCGVRVTGCGVRVRRCRVRGAGHILGHYGVRFRVSGVSPAAGEKTAGLIEKETEVSYDLPSIRLRAPAVVTLGCDYGSAGRAYACDLI